MNVLNMFQEDEPVKTLTVPPVYTPEIPTIQQQATDAIIGDTQYGLQEPTTSVAPEPTREELIKMKMDEYTKSGLNPLNALIQKAEPVFDEQKAKRLKFASAANALGQGLSTLYGGYIGSKGGPILQQENTVTPAALAEYNQMLQADKEAKYRTAMMKNALAGDVFKMSVADVNRDEQIKAASNSLKKQQEFTAQENEKNRQAEIEKAKTRSSGRSFDEEAALINLKYDRMAELEAVKEGRMTELEKLRQSGKISQAQYNAEKRKEVEKYKAEMEKVTRETTGFEDGKEIKTKTQTTVVPDKAKSSTQQRKVSGKSGKSYDITPF